MQDQTQLDQVVLYKHRLASHSQLTTKIMSGHCLSFIYFEAMDRAVLSAMTMHACVCLVQV